MIPLITALIGGWLAYDAWHKRGPTITITFQNAEGLQAGQSHVRHKDVDMGLVTKIALTPDRRKVQITVDMQREAAPLLTEGTQFWVVKPRFFAGNVTGLETLLSGAYVELSPPKDSGGDPKWDFVGLEDPPVLQSDVPGRTFLLQADRIGSISLGSPIFYRDLNVGQVLGWDFADMARSVTLHAFVREPFDQYVHDNSRFWNASGVDLRVGADGVHLEVESLRAVILGGIAFETPLAEPAAGVSAENQAFPLFPSHERALAAAYDWKIPLVSYFDTSVRGLGAGAPVELHGIRVGQVTDVQLQYDRKTKRFSVPVHYEVEPQRIADAQVRASGEAQQDIRAMVDQGLRAQLSSGNLITGQKLISLDIIDHAPPAEMKLEGNVIVLPTAPGGGLDETLKAASAVMAKIEAIPFDEIGANLNDALKGAAQVSNGPELRNALMALQGTLASAQTLVKQLNAGLQPALKQLPDVVSDLQQTLSKANKLVGSVDQTYAGNSAFSRDLERLMAQLNDTAASVRVLADLLTRHPEALIRGRTDTGLQ